MKNRRRTGNHNQHLRLRRESRGINVNGVRAERHCVKVKLAIVAGLGRHFERRIVGLERGMCAADRVVLRVVHHAAHVPKYCRETIGCEQQQRHRRYCDEHMTLMLHRFSTYHRLCLMVRRPRSRVPQLFWCGIAAGMQRTPSGAADKAMFLCLGAYAIGGPRFCTLSKATGTGSAECGATVLVRVAKIDTGRLNDTSPTMVLVTAGATRYG